MAIDDVAPGGVVAGVLDNVVVNDKHKGHAYLRSARGGKPQVVS